MITCCHTVTELRSLISAAKKSGKTIGLVPTMGALHEGHASLIAASHRENDLTVTSVFVNPTQFGPSEDFDAYPRTLEADLTVAEKAGADIVFAPSPKEMYPFEDRTWVEVTGVITKVLCGRTRPIHFRGVTTVVTKLLHLAQPDRAYFGQKDAQQAQVLRRMVADLFFPVELRIMPIIREADGLAKSSRNTYLSQEEHQAGLVLSQALKAAAAAFAAGEQHSAVLVEKVRAQIAAEPAAAIDYVEIHRLPALDEAQTVITEPHLLAVAVKFGNTRLIDNIILEK